MIDLLSKNEATPSQKLSERRLLKHNIGDCVQLNDLFI